MRGDFDEDELDEEPMVLPKADCIIHLPRPECQIGHAHVIDACGAFQPKDLHADTCHFGRDAECDCGKPSFTHCRMCGHIQVG
jgi:hypothetical protein